MLGSYFLYERKKKWSESKERKEEVERKLFFTVKTKTQRYNEKKKE